MAKKRGRRVNDEKIGPEFDFGPLYHQINLISRCLGIIAMRFSPEKPQKISDRIRFLGFMGFTNQEIAGMLNTKAAIVAVRKAEARKRRKQRRPPGKKKERKRDGKD